MSLALSGVAEVPLLPPLQPVLEVSTNLTDLELFRKFRIPIMDKWDDVSG